MGGKRVEEVIEVGDARVEPVDPGGVGVVDAAGQDHGHRRLQRLERPQRRPHRFCVLGGRHLADVGLVAELDRGDRVALLVVLGMLGPEAAADPIAADEGEDEVAVELGVAEFVAAQQGVYPGVDFPRGLFHHLLLFVDRLPRVPLVAGDGGSEFGPLFDFGVDPVRVAAVDRDRQRQRGSFRRLGGGGGRPRQRLGGVGRRADGEDGRDQNDGERSGDQLRAGGSHHCRTP
jgi:hypothetical protein